ncbi:hypothetical protein NECAME_05525 [Necator americanus]|uniref:Neurotransmitter-gated ion-channel transmembrane domain-containing protein n=1 Tax=Necator americanus TaxID=51031 RepID=W2SGF6_NECAM|nr:hypothetical protein NECAME_05525 [Necator americanus]ETN68680.1 hypothetical protein NECAME_05525 [Necator americanus]
MFELKCDIPKNDTRQPILHLPTVVGWSIQFRKHLPQSGDSKNTERQKPAEKWKSTIKQVQKTKRESARCRAKQIDQMSRWVFPLSFVAFNAMYWSYYLYFKS